jgi:polyphosphate kinase
MHRNLDRRVECLVRIFDPAHVRKLEEILDIGLSDQTQSWRLAGQRWTRHAVAEDGTRLTDAHSHHLNKNLKGS